MRLIPAPAARMSEAMVDFTNAVRVLAPEGRAGLAVDLTALPSSQWSEILARCLKRTEAG